MNPQWNTPPDGDFARYVERLSAQSAIARSASHAGGEHGLEGGPVPASSPAPRQRAAIGSNWGRSSSASTPTATSTPGSSPYPFRIARIAAVAWLLALVALLGAGASFGLLVALVAGGLWAAAGLRRWALPQGHSSWSAWLKETAATLARQQRDRRSGPDNR